MDRSRRQAAANGARGVPRRPGWIAPSDRILKLANRPSYRSRRLHVTWPGIRQANLVRPPGSTTSAGYQASKKSYVIGSKLRSRIMNKIIIGLVSLSIAALMPGIAGAWSHAGAYGGHESGGGGSWNASGARGASASGGGGSWSGRGAYGGSASGGGGSWNARGGNGGSASGGGGSWSG